jgi:hypothetical protein
MPRLAFLFLVGAGAADPAPLEWLPPGFEQASIAMLVPRLQALGPDGPGADKAETAAREVTQEVPRRVESWGDGDVVKRAPALRALGLPQNPQRHLAAMARYFACIAAYEVLNTRGAFAGAPAGERLTAAKASFGLTIATLYLRHRYQRATGESGDAIEAFLTGPQMEPVFQRLQNDASLLQTAYEECRPLAAALVD